MSNDQGAKASRGLERSKKMRVLISAYACEPDRGSEPGVGWNISVAASKFCEVWVVTRANNREKILAASEGLSIHWLFYDLPRWMQWLKKKLGLVSLYYLFWQIGSRSLILRSLSEHKIDFIHHVTFGSAFFPPPICRPEFPLLWGPVGGLMSAPRSFFKWFSWRGQLVELLRPIHEWVALRSHIPLVDRRGVYALTVSEHSRLRFPPGLRARTCLLSQVGIRRQDWESLATDSRFDGEGRFIVFMAGRLVHWKGFGFGIEAFSNFAHDKDDVELRIIGDGPEMRFLKRLVRKRGLGSKVSFLGGLDKARYQDELKNATISLFPSLHEPGAFVVVEALAAGKPVICFAGTEPATEVSDATGFRIPLKTSADSLAGFVAAMERLYSTPGLLKEMSVECRKRAYEFIWERRLSSLQEIYDKTLSHNGLTCECIH